ncbi:hypothetical protein B0I37DRAFT_225239 [Chaetomium sp. MPI-CAGE-AT-0009]|nr:hypothetical protein B0I37DRAFT_225239 [Chaetomium sp. MPI-CAGE-AT-0009]
MMAGNSRALWWRPHTRAAWRVQQAALARVKWLREDARRMDSTTGGLTWIWPRYQRDLGNTGSKAAPRCGTPRSKKWPTANSATSPQAVQHGRGLGKRKRGNKSNRRGPQNETDRRAQHCCFCCFFAASAAAKILPFRMLQPAHLVRSDGQRPWRSVRSPQPTSAGQMRGRGREGARVGRQVRVLGQLGV